MSKKIKFISIFFAISAIVTIYAPYVRADGPPPPPFTVYVSYDNKKISDQMFYMVLMQCGGTESPLPPAWESSDFRAQLKNLETPDKQNTPQYQAYSKLNALSQNELHRGCEWKPFYLPNYMGACINSACQFKYILGNYKAAVYLPSLDKTFISGNDFNREYAGTYGLDTAKFYEMDIAKDGTSKLYQAPERKEFENWDNATETPRVIVNPFEYINNFGFWIAVFISFLFTLTIELIVAIVFVFISKSPKRILLGVLVGNAISVPLLWILVTFFYRMLFPAEILVVIFEARVMRHFSKNKMTWKQCILLSFIMNVLSFIFGPILFMNF